MVIHDSIKIGISMKSVNFQFEYCGKCKLLSSSLVYGYGDGSEIIIITLFGECSLWAQKIIPSDLNKVDPFKQESLQRLMVSSLVHETPC